MPTIVRAPKSKTKIAKAKNATRRAGPPPASDRGGRKVAPKTVARRTPRPVSEPKPVARRVAPPPASDKGGRKVAPKRPARRPIQNLTSDQRRKLAGAAAKAATSPAAKAGRRRAAMAAQRARANKRIARRARPTRRFV